MHGKDQIDLVTVRNKMLEIERRKYEALCANARSFRHMNPSNRVVEHVNPSNRVESCVRSRINNVTVRFPTGSTSKGPGASPINILQDNDKKDYEQDEIINESIDVNGSNRKRKNQTLSQSARKRKSGEVNLTSMDCDDRHKGEGTESSDCFRPVSVLVSNHASTVSMVIDFCLLSSELQEEHLAFERQVQQPRKRGEGNQGNGLEDKQLQELQDQMLRQQPPSPSITYDIVYSQIWDPSQTQSPQSMNNMGGSYGNSENYHNNDEGDITPKWNISWLKKREFHIL